MGEERAAFLGVVGLRWFGWGGNGRRGGTGLVIGWGDGAHELGDLEGGGGGFGTAVVLWFREATLTGLIKSVEKQYLMNDGEMKRF